MKAQWQLQLTMDCFDYLVELLFLICTNFEFGLIVGDFNFDVDKPEDRWAKELCCVLNLTLDSLSM